MRGTYVSSRPSDRDRASAAGLRRIVVPLDGTPYAEAAVPPAVALGRTYNAEVVLLRAHVARAEHVRTRLGLRRYERETLGRASLYLARIEQDLRTQGVRAVGVSPIGQPADAIADVARLNGDLVVIATHAGQARSAQMSVARKLATRVEVPMLLVSPATRGLFTQSASTPTIVVALDGERRDDVSLRLVTTLAGSFSGRVLAVGSTHEADHKHAASVPGGVLTQEHQTAGVASYLEKVRFDLARRDVAAWTALVGGDLAAEIARLACVEGSLVVLGMHGTLAQREATAETAMTLLRSTGAAVLLVSQRPLFTDVPGALLATSGKGDIQ